MINDKLAGSTKQFWKPSIAGVMNPPRVIKQSAKKAGKKMKVSILAREKTVQK